MKSRAQSGVKTKVIFDQSLIEEIDRINPFSTRTEFLAFASREYLEKLKHEAINKHLAEACAEATEEDRLENDEWENVTLETWS